MDQDSGWVIVVPQSMLRDVIKECHGDGHAWRTEDSHDVQAALYYVKGAKKDIRDYVTSCIPCKRAKICIVTDQVSLIPSFTPDPFNAI